MFLRVNQRRRHLLFASPTLRVRPLPIIPNYCTDTDYIADANLFKEAFIKAQQENEKIFSEASKE